MTDGDDLLRTILLEPGEDVHRLKYADWLDEHGEGDRAEFVRVQCELAQSGPNDSDIARHMVLSRRERELLDAHALDWSGPAARAMGLPAVTVFTPGLEYGYGDTSWRFTRGFVSHITLSLAAFLGGPCGRCDGTGMVGPVNDRDRLCPDCPDSSPGTLPGVAAAVFGACPIEGVTLSDRGPSETHLKDPNRAWAWIREDPRRPGATNPAYLPAALYDMLSDYSDESAQGIRFYATRELALAALSNACVAFGRRRAQTDTVSVGEVGS